jgi:hypothetical protein
MYLSAFWLTVITRPNLKLIDTSAFHMRTGEFVQYFRGQLVSIETRDAASEQVPTYEA